VSAATELLAEGVDACAVALADGLVRSIELVDATLRRIDQLDQQVNAFRSVWATEAFDAALMADRARRDGTAGRLAGIPIALKDDLDVEGRVTGNGSSACDTPAAADAEVVARLRRAGMVMIGKTNLPEFGQWAFTETALHGVTRNPRNLERTPGGSSGGSAAAVAAGMVPAAIGSDGGGSIRIPAACCGLFGLKTTRGRVSTAPATHCWHGLGVVGPLTRTVLDSAILNDVIRGNLPTDEFRCDDPPTSFEQAARTDPTPLRVALVTTPSIRGVDVDDDCIAAAETVAALLGELGHDVEVVDPGWPDAMLAFVARSSRGVAEESASTPHPELLERRTRVQNALFRSAPRPLVRWATGRAERISVKANVVFDTYDLVVTPALGSLPPAAGSLGGAGLVRAARGSLWAIPFTTLWNVAGNPAATLPSGLWRDGIPLAAQLVAPLGDECTLLQVAGQIERARPWSAARPEGT